jgi:hypothetical protein
MRLPSYRYIILKEDSFTQRLQSLKRYEFSENPIVFDMGLIRESSQDDVLTSLITELRKLNLSQIPYRVYIMSKSSLKFDDFIIVKNEQKLPLFHKKKEKSINVREASLLNKIKLKQRKLSQIENEYYQKALKEYADHHKDIAHKQEFINFLNHIKSLK